MAWDDVKRAKAISMYTEGKPTPANTIELLKSISEDLGETANGVRMILQKAEVYVKKEEGEKKTATKEKAEGTARVSKADSIAALVSAIEATGYIVDNDIIDKLTGKQAIYFTSVINAVKPAEEIEE